MTRKFLLLFLSYAAVTSRGEAAQIPGRHRPTPTHTGHAPAHAHALIPRHQRRNGQPHADPLVTTGKVNSPYEYQYAVRRDQATPLSGHDTPLFGHTEAHNGHTRKGKYFVHLPDGRVQTVTYYADETGYHPTVSYEGTAHYDAHAAVPHHTPAKAYHAPEPAHHAPEPTYHAPEPAYHAPEPAYHVPEPAYHALRPRHKTPAYNTLKPAYHNPGPTHRASIPTHAPEQAYKYPKTTYTAPEQAYDAPQLSRKIPHAVHQAPEPAYKIPEPTYYTPKPAYETPERVYHAPKPTYTTPKPEYTIPKPTYHAPGSINHASGTVISYTTPQPAYHAPEPSQSTHATAPHPLALSSDLQVTSQPRHPTSLGLPDLPTAALPTQLPPKHRNSSPTPFPKQTLAVPLSGLSGRHSAGPVIHDLLSTSGIDFDADDLRGPGPRPLAMRSNGQFDATTAAFDLSETLFRNAVDSWPELRP
ncbi:extensin-1-like [Penaeus monodon]|uniref:extensin-1-like n=1 Tax=Penaeus monodon TaxID=6687 RepID=UPI0018A7D78D|nr:extensin-1-like [Penaeus monodon]